MDVQRVVRVDFDMVFPKEVRPTSIEELIKTIPTFMIIKGNSLIMTNLNNPQYLIKEIILQGFLVKNNNVAFSISQILRKKDYQNFIFFTLQGCMKMYEYAIANPCEGGLIGLTAEQELNLFKAYLMIHQFENDKSENRKLQFKNGYWSDIVHKARMFLVDWLPQYQYEQTSNKQDFHCLFIKLSYLYKWLDNNPSVLSVFLHHKNVKTFQEYILKTFELIFPTAQNPDFITYSIDITNADQMTKDFFEQMCVQENDVIDVKDDNLKIRQKPLYKLSENEYQILNKYFLMDKLFTGMYFELFSIAQKDKNILPKTKTNFRQFYTTHFSEGLLFIDVADDIFRHRKHYVIKTNVDTSGTKLENLCDYYVRNNKDIFLFENKDSILKVESKNSYDFDKIEKDLKEKYYENPKEGKKNKKKAVLQLIEGVKKILDKSICEVDPKTECDKVHIYPILVVHEEVMRQMGINVIINDWFQKEIEKDNFLLMNKERIKPLTVIHIDALIFFKELLKKKWELSELLDNYWRRLKKLYKKEIIEDNALLTFDLYLVDQLKTLEKADKTKYVDFPHWKKYLQTVFPNAS